ncbi:MAG: LTA synthase family protein [Lachnospiraceae bacterium]|nr:LTA synthase family protein [Lachnospiraceae bacterium]
MELRKKQDGTYYKKRNIKKAGRISRYLNGLGKYQNEAVRDGYVLCYVLLPVLLVMAVESLSRHSLMGGFQFLIYQPYAFLANAMMVAAAFTTGLLFRKRISVILSVGLFVFLCGAANGIVLFFRVTPLTSSDLLLLKDGFAIAAKYLNLFGMAGIVLLLLLAAVVFAAFFLKIPAGQKPAYTRSIPVILAAFLAAWGGIYIGQVTGLLETEFRELAQSYRKNGFIYCFAASLVDTGIQKPEGYSTETIGQLTENYEGETEVQYDTQKPNVVIVQLESFFNVNRLKNVTFSENPLPNFTRLMEQYPSGAFRVPVVGAGTVNSEFEVLTGMNIDDFGIGEYPYKTVLKEKACESLAYDLKSHGYQAFAIHDHEGDFYERNQVYPNLGFDVFTSVEYMWPEAYTATDWVKDATLVDEIKTALDSTAKPDFVFAVSVQGHGSYPSDAEEDYIHHVTVSSSSITDEAYLNQISYYVNQLYEMDQFIGELLKMLRSRAEATVLVMYGDHLPSLDFTDELLSSGSVYETDYVIWNNAGLTFADQPLQAYELGPLLLGRLEVTDGAVNAYHQKSRRQMEEGTITEEEYLESLKELEYDILYGDQIIYGGKDPYVPTQMQMGLEPVVIDFVRLTKDSVLVVEGQNFTRYSKVLIDGTAAETLYLDPETLVVPEADIEESAQITVAQSTLSETVPYVFRIPVTEQ